MVGPYAETCRFLDGPVIHHVRSAEESRELSTRRGPCIIVASSGMCEGGRILQHLKQNIDDPRCTVVLVSYQAPHTLGWRLMQPRPTVRFHGRDWNLWAHVLKLDGFSGHAGHDDLLSYLAPLAGVAGKVRLVHGEPEAADALAADLRAAGFADVAAPVLGETVAVG
jgi:metallo-beta-lactamase family protein